MNFENVKVNCERWLQTNKFKNEFWKDIKGYENLYQVSNYGRIKSLERVVTKKYHGNRKQKERILKQFKDRHGYYFIKLQKNKIIKNVYVHRLVAETFILNPNNYAEINHIQTVTKDSCINTVDNLVWCTHEQNMKHPPTLEKMRVKRINCYDLLGNFIKTYNSINNAVRELNLCYSSILACCRGHKHHKRVGKYVFKYYKGDEENED